MKRSIFSKILALILCLILALSSFTVNVFALDEDADIDMGDDVIIETLEEVYVSASGSDSNAGTEAAPFATLAKATKRVASGGTIHIVGTFTVPADSNWADRTNILPVTVTGGTLSLASNDLVIGFNVIFKDITINGGKALYANGNDVTFGSGANASAVTVYGGSKSGETLESTNLTIAGGTLGTVYGGSSVACTINQVNLTITSGTVSSVFGGNNASNLTGNVTVFINGGTISDSIFGGCYNNYTYKSGLFGNIGASISWDTSYYVTGKVDVIVSENATINTNSSSGTTDKAFFAHSRHKTLSANEDTSIIFTSQTAYNNNSSKLGTKTSKGSYGTSNNLAGAGMGTDAASSADNIHIHGLTADDTADTITEGCNVTVGTEVDPCDSATITLTLNKKASLVYTGAEIAPMIADVTGTLTYDEPIITYSNNVNPGTYYVRYAETDYAKVSESTTVVIEAGRMLTVTFIADGAEVAVKEVTYGATLTDIPAVPAKVGYDKVAPYWDVTDFANITSDVTVNAVYTINTYTVTYIADGVTISTQTVNYGDNAVAPEIPAKDGYTETAPSWDAEATNVTADLTINAVYTKDLPKITPADTDNDGNVNLNDLITLAQYVAGWNNADAYVPALDINGDKAIDLLDVNLLAQYLAGWDVEISTAPYVG